MFFVIFSYNCLANANDIELIGAGATFPLPFYLKAFNTYQEISKVRIEYRGVGSGEGLLALKNKTVDFAGTDFIKTNCFPENIDELVYIPTCLGAVAIVYNIAGNPPIRLTPDVLSDIFLGKIKKWNHEKLKAINQGLKLPDLPITVIRRADASGTTYVFTEFLSSLSFEWKNKVGIKNLLSGLTGLEAKGNPGVAGLVKQISGSIGYVELVYALANNLPRAYIINNSGVFVEPSKDSIKKAAEGYNFKKRYTTLIETTNKDGYPISCFTFIALYKNQDYGRRDIKKAKELIKMLEWLITDGQQFTTQLHYVPLPSTIQKSAQEALNQIHYGSLSLTK